MSDTIDQEHHTIRFERMLQATPHEVFDAWTLPEEVTKWWDPGGTPLVSCSIDLRPEGAFCFVTAGHAPPFEGTYEVVERPNRLEFQAMGAKGIVTLHPHGTGTRMSVSIGCASAEHFETLLQLGVQPGTSTTLDNLAAHLSRRAREAEVLPP